MASLLKRGKKFYIQYCVAGRVYRKSLSTGSYQIARELVRQFESAQAQGDDCPLPTKTPIAHVVAEYVMRCIDARVHAILVRFRQDGEQTYADSVRCDRWEVVLPELVFAPDANP